MKRILWVVLLATLALPLAAFADSSIDFTNAGGTLSGGSAGLTLSDSTLIAIGSQHGNDRHSPSGRNEAWLRDARTQADAHGHRS